jgi:hypothetical protein
LSCCLISLSLSPTLSLSCYLISLSLALFVCLSLPHSLCHAVLSLSPFSQESDTSKVTLCSALQGWRWSEPELATDRFPSFPLSHTTGSHRRSCQSIIMVPLLWLAGPNTQRTLDKLLNPHLFRRGKK